MGVLRAPASLVVLRAAHLAATVVAAVATTEDSTSLVGITALGTLGVGSAGRVHMSDMKSVFVVDICCNSGLLASLQQMHSSMCEEVTSADKSQTCSACK